MTIEHSTKDVVLGNGVEVAIDNNGVYGCFEHGPLSLCDFCFMVCHVKNDDGDKVRDEDCVCPNHIIYERENPVSILNDSHIECETCGFQFEKSSCECPNCSLLEHSEHYGFFNKKKGWVCFSNCGGCYNETGWGSNFTTCLDCGEQRGVNTPGCSHCITKQSVDEGHYGYFDLLNGWTCYSGCPVCYPPTEEDEPNWGCKILNGHPFHEYSEIKCPVCNSTDNCWSCSVRVTDDSSGAGMFHCRTCGYISWYPEIKEETSVPEMIPKLKDLQRYFGTNGNPEYLGSQLKEMQIPEDWKVIFREPNQKIYTLQVADLYKMGNKSAGEDEILAVLM